MEEFLNSENFEKMAREYNQKYASVSVLEVENVDKTALQKLFEDIHILFVMLNKMDLGNRQNFDAKANLVYDELNILGKKFGLENKNIQKISLPTTFRGCIKQLISVLKSIQNLQNKENFEVFSVLQNKILEALSAYFSGF